MKSLFILISALFLSATAVAHQEPHIQLVPQEAYFNTAMRLLDSVNADTKLIRFLQLEFPLQQPSDNGGPDLAKQLADKLIAVHTQFPQADLKVLLESKWPGIAESNAVTKTYLEKSGILCGDVYGAFDPDLGANHPQGVSHTKVILVDDIVLAGSTNLSNDSLTPGHNNEMNLMTNSAVIAATVKAYIDQVEQDPSHLHDLMVNDGGSFDLSTDELVIPRLLRVIRESRHGEKIDISMYEFQYRNDTDQIPKMLIDELIAASLRGVQIRILLERTAQPDKDVYLSNLVTAKQLAQNGIQVYFDPVAKISHSKYLIYIGRHKKIAIVGSSNFTSNDLLEYHQINWQLNSPHMVQQLENYYTNMLTRDGELFKADNP